MFNDLRPVSTSALASESTAVPPRCCHTLFSECRGMLLQTWFRKRRQSWGMIMQTYLERITLLYYYNNVILHQAYISYKPCSVSFIVRLLNVCKHFKIIEHLLNLLLPVGFDISACDRFKSYLSDWVVIVVADGFKVPRQLMKVLLKDQYYANCF